MTKQRQRELIDKAFESKHLNYIETTETKDNITITMMIWDGTTIHYEDSISRQRDAYHSLEIICICAEYEKIAERFTNYE